MSMRKAMLGTLMVLMTLGVVPAHAGKMPITTSSDEARQAYLEGELLMDSAQRDRARPLFEKAVRLDPDFIMAHFSLAGTQLRGADVRSIMENVEEMAARVEMSDGERLFIEGQLASQNGDRATLVSNFERMAELYPDDERILMNLGGLFYGTDNETAISWFRKSVAANPQFAPVYNTLGYCYKGIGRNEEAAAAFEKAIEIEPENPNGYDSYGELLLRMGRFEESIKSYERVLDIEPLFPSAQMGIASNLVHLERHDEARSRLREIDEIAPHDGIRSGMCWALAVTHLDQGNHELALAEFENNLALSRGMDNPGSVSGDLFTIARVLLEAGEIDAAAGRFAESAEISRSNARNERSLKFVEARGHMADMEIATARGAFEEAHEHAAAYEQIAVEMDNRFMRRTAHEMRGTIALAAGQSDHALEELQQCDVTNVRNMYRIAQAYDSRGSEDSAREWYGYVVNYRGSLNLHYSMVRHEAQRRLSAL